MTRVRRFGESALLVELAGADAAQALRRGLLERPIDGVVDLVPGRASLLVEIDPLGVDPVAMERALAERVATGAPIAAEGRSRSLPVVYGGTAGPDLGRVAREIGIDPDELVEAHAAIEHRVALCGFAPGFAYLDGLPADWRISRLQTPRLRTPPGSIGVADGMTGTYPAQLPGGWPIIGRTPRVLFDHRRPRPAYLEPGDRVRFVPIAADAWDRHAGAADDW